MGPPGSNGPVGEPGPEVSTAESKSCYLGIMGIFYFFNLDIDLEVQNLIVQFTWRKFFVF